MDPAMMYPQDEDQGNGTSASPTPEQLDNESAEEQGEYATLPSSMFHGDLKPGDTVTLEVVKTLEDEVMVRPVESEEQNEAPMEQSMSDLEGLQEGE